MKQHFAFWGFIFGLLSSLSLFLSFVLIQPWDYNCDFMNNDYFNVFMSFSKPLWILCLPGGILSLMFIKEKKATLGLVLSMLAIFIFTLFQLNINTVVPCM